ncbi:hypothetical protein OFY05_22990 (plasmid) [Pseudocitrobacter faecalis]|nr:hypothetical protein OFY05_22990 [Pseudocitrobacter faecalis]
MLSVATVNTADDNYDIYIKAGAGSQKLVVNLQSAGAVVETLEVLEVVDTLPEDAVEGAASTTASFQIRMALLPERWRVMPARRPSFKPLVKWVG